jgi:phytoene dehydrogenase-like protein
MKTDVLIIGGGIAGLNCSLELKKAGISSLILEKSSEAGGRIKTLKKEGFLIDLGFQVLLSSYDQIYNTLEYSNLKMKYFDSGAILSSKKKQVKVYKFCMKDMFEETILKTHNLKINNAKSTGLIMI